MDDILRRLGRENFTFDKRYGQNFITDTGILRGIAEDAGVDKGDTVLEIGAGAGTLTRELAARAGRVVAFEIDRRLEPVLTETLGGADNVTVRYGDIMRESEEALSRLVGERFKVVANLPYYITTPILFMLLERRVMPKSITVMVQKEVAERMVATETRGDYGALSVAVALRAEARITRVVGRENFTPPPNVDSAVVRMDIRPEAENADLSAVSELVRKAFAMKRKTLVNNLVAGYGIGKAEAIDLVRALGMDDSVRAEQLSPRRFVALSEMIKKKGF